MSPSSLVSPISSLSPHHSVILQQWLSSLKAESSSIRDDPDYFQSNPSSLLTTSLLQSFTLGNGLQVLSQINASILSAQHEVLFVTCFWASSASRDAFCAVLTKLSSHALAQNRRIRVRIGISSLSLIQKLTQTNSLHGKLYPPSTWVSVLGLPSPDDLRWLDLEIRSVFVLPFSVMHSKFCIVDRTKLFVPSCNVSWENWLEGCVELQGDVLNQALLFWLSFWGRRGEMPNLLSPTGTASTDGSLHALMQSTQSTTDYDIDSAPISCVSLTQVLRSPVPTLFLPSPHHINPLMRPFSRDHAPPPATPLNVFLLTLFATAKDRIYIQSPNVNSPPVIAALCQALKRGVHVKIVTNTRMMVPEQLITAGRLTEWTMSSLYSMWQAECDSHDPRDIESAPSPPGNLEIYYHDPSSPLQQTSGHAESEAYWDFPFEKPLKSHIKLTIVDDSIVVLGSGNMDRASWYTSQELGIAFFSPTFAQEVLRDIGVALEKIGVTKYGR